ncbi:MAG: class I SAM-dependent methyltransferase [Haliea sp.]
MIALWPQIIRPLTEAINGRTLLEIGAEQGLSTNVLLDYVQSTGGHLHCIDPSPEFDPKNFVAKYGSHLTFHQDLSLNVLSNLPQVDVALVDGDHNWYTVFNELKLIEEVHGSDPDIMPLIFVHDIGWPYGRRDLYYDPTTIPAEYLRPFAQRGIGRHKTELREDGGLNCNLFNAVIEGGPKNGVLTGVEDYLGQSKLDFIFLNLPLYFGLGILIPRKRVEKNNKLQSEITVLHDYLKGSRLVKIAEQLRLNTLMVLQGVQRDLDSSKSRIQELEASLAALTFEKKK